MTDSSSSYQMAELMDINKYPMLLKLVTNSEEVDNPKEASLKEGFDDVEEWFSSFNFEGLDVDKVESALRIHKEFFLEVGQDMYGKKGFIGVPYQEDNDHYKFLVESSSEVRHLEKFMNQNA